MRGWPGGKAGGLVAFVLIAALLAGGLGWATAVALRLEGEQLAERAAAVRAVRLRLALGRLDGRVAPLLAREDARPFNHYSTLFPPPLALTTGGAPVAPGSVLEPSPLLQAELPGWMLLHFQADAAPDGGCWASPQVPPAALRRLKDGSGLTALPNVTAGRARLLAELAAGLPPAQLLAAARERAAPATLRDTTFRLARRDADLVNSLDNLAPQQKAANPTTNAGRGGPAYDQQLSELNESRSPRRVQRDLAYSTIRANGQSWPGPVAKEAAGAEVTVRLTPMAPLWLRPRGGPERLAFVRLVHAEDLEVCQGVVLDADALRQTLTESVVDLFPDARLVPAGAAGADEPETSMATLPFRLDPGPEEPPDDPGWTTPRVGLLAAWTAAAVALLAVGLGGWSLLDLSERRARFVSAVTHELRTPLTTLRLYLDMLVGGMVRETGRREEYLRTLHGEAERLHRLVANVLDFARLERQRPRPVRARVAAADLLGRVREAWQRRCDEAGKELVVEPGPDGAWLQTDAELVQQVLGNLIDNACKYSRGADDRRVWLRFVPDGRRAAFEVEDRGPGVPVRERRAIFRAFRRGRAVDAAAGGVGLGLALARRWAAILGGRLVLGPAAGGACFRLELPAGGGGSGCPARPAGEPVA
jgi:signal transduction histidine kinase